MVTQAIEIQSGLGTVICYINTSSNLTCRAIPKTTEIPLKGCSAYGEIDHGAGGEREEAYIYEQPQ